MYGIYVYKCIDVVFHKMQKKFRWIFFTDKRKKTQMKNDGFLSRNGFYSELIGFSFFLDKNWKLLFYSIHLSLWMSSMDVERILVGVVEKYYVLKIIFYFLSWLAYTKERTLTSHYFYLLASFILSAPMKYLVW